MITSTITPSTCYYIPASALSGISEPAKQAMNMFFAADIDVSFGDSNRTMIDIPCFMLWLQSAIEQQGLWNELNGAEGYNDIADALDQYVNEVYIDLEN